MVNSNDKSAGEWLNFNHDLLRSVVKIQQSFIGELDIRTAFSSILGELLSLTESGYGFIGEVLYDPQPYLVTHALTDISWDEESKKIYDENMAKGFEFRNLNTLFGASLITRKSVISNSPATDARSGGLPHGHPGMSAYLGLPIMKDGEMLGLLGLANRPGGYSTELADLLEPAMITCGTMIAAVRQEQQTKQIKNELVTQNHLLDAVLLNIKDGILLVDFNGTIELANQSAATDLNSSVDRLISSLFTEHLSTDCGATFEQKIANFLSSGDLELLSGELEVSVNSDNSSPPTYLEIGISQLQLGHRKLFVINLHDISIRKQQSQELEAANAALKELSETDSLTQLPNRRFFERSLSSAFRSSHRLDVEMMMAIIDIDHFKLYNDYYGHPAGDRVLFKVASLFTSKLQREVEVCARIGGEEFAVIVVGCSRDEFHHLMTSLAVGLRELSIEHADSELQLLTISIGCAQLDNEMSDCQQLYEAADKALYSAKDNGRDCVVWYEPNAS